VRGQHSSDLNSDSRWCSVVFFLWEGIRAVFGRQRREGMHVWRDLKSSSQTNLVKYTDRTFPWSGISDTNPLPSSA
jgi:hypothetical protein